MWCQLPSLIDKPNQFIWSSLARNELPAFICQYKALTPLLMRIHPGFVWNSQSTCLATSAPGTVVPLIQKLIVSGSVAARFKLLPYVTNPDPVVDRDAVPCFTLSVSKPPALRSPCGDPLILFPELSV